MGFDVSQVISDDKHYSPFICIVCQNLLSLDAVVTSPCSHAFCRECLESFAAHHQAQTLESGMFNDEEDCSCPACDTDISPAQPLETAQPLAYTVLKQVQVACTDCSSSPCRWSGDYGDFLLHAASHGAEAVSKPFMDTQPSDPAVTPPKRPKRPTLGQNGKSLSEKSLSMHIARQNQNPTNGDIEGEGVSLDQDQRPGSLRAAMKKSKSFREKENAVADTEDSSSVSNSLESLKSALVAPRWTSNGSISTDPVVPKTTIPGTGARDAPPLLVKRSKSDDGNKIDKHPDSVVRGQRRKPATLASTLAAAAKESEDPEGSYRQPLDLNLKTSIGNSRAQRRTSKESDDLEGSYSQMLDWNTSISSLGDWNNSFVASSESALPPMETVEEDQENDFMLQLEPEDDEEEEKAEEETPVPNAELLMETAEKLRKQANAKFNKGAFAASRQLYTEGIDVMESMVPTRTIECELVSNLYSNRAVTFFREKKFDSCVEDCDKAIAYDPLYDKSWIRKWRALTALGNVDAAYACLELASQTVGESSRIDVELGKARQENKLITQARALFQKGEMAQAKEKLKPHTRSTENIGLLFLAARADCALGHTESALEKVNRALRFNPTHAEGLELRGYALFLSGDTEKGAHLLQDAYIKDKDNKEVRLNLSRCQKTHSAFAQGRSCVKRGRYKEAVDQLTIAIKESGEVPKGAPLFGALRTERAEALLLSKKFSEALKDCQAVINADTENATAWAIRAEVLVAMGRADEAKDELACIRRTWGLDNPVIDEGYRRVDFELRVQKADDDLSNLLVQLQAGTVERIPARDELPERKQSAKGERSKRAAIHRKPKTDDRKTDDGKRRSSSRTGRRSTSISRNGRTSSNSRSRSRVRKNNSGSISAAPSTSLSITPPNKTFMPPPSGDDIPRGSSSQRRHSLRR